MIIKGRYRDPGSGGCWYYNGTLSLSVSGNDQGTSDSQVKITAEEGGTVQEVLVSGGAGEGMMSLPDIAIPGIKVQTSDNVTYTFSGKCY